VSTEKHLEKNRKKNERLRKIIDDENKNVQSGYRRSVCNCNITPSREMMCPRRETLVRPK
jgi:hypothetical protein